MEKIGLAPLMNFAQVSETVFRSAQPRYEYQYDWIKDKLGVEVLVNLRSESDLDDRIGTKHGFEVFDIKVPDHHAPTLEQVKKFKKFYSKNKHKKMLVHCAHGQGRTTTFCVLIRLFDGWQLDEALCEQREVYHYSFKHQEQLEFLKKL